MKLDSVVGAGGQLEWRQAVLQNFVLGNIDSDQARVLSTLIAGASAVKPPVPSKDDQEDGDSVENSLLELNRKLTGKEPDQVLLKGE